MKNKIPSAPTDIAAWMLEEIRREGMLYQQTAVYEISDRFGEDYTYLNAAGNPAIDKRVLAAFRVISEDKVVWSRGDRAWRLREDHDEPGRQQY